MDETPFAVYINEVWYIALPFPHPVLDEPMGWWLSGGSDDYFVQKVRGTLQCSCPAYSPERGCKHTKSIQSTLLEHTT